MVTETAVAATQRKEAAAENPASTALVVLEEIDDSIILAELGGKAVKSWAYRLPGRDDIEGLTINGVSAVCRQMAAHGEALRVLNFKYEETEKHVTGHCRVGRYLVRPDGTDTLLDVALGTRRELKQKQRKNNGGWYNDDTALEKAMSKAERNGKSKLLDENIRQQVLAMALEAPETIVTVTEGDQARAGRRQIQAESGRKPTENDVTIQEERRKFYAKLKDKEIDSKAKMHEALGLDCPSDKGHTKDVEGTDKECHALVEWIAARDEPEAKAWAVLAYVIEQGMTVGDREKSEAERQAQTDEQNAQYDGKDAEPEVPDEIPFE